MDEDQILEEAYKHRWGEGVPKDPQKALELYEIGISKGYDFCKYEAGSMLKDGASGVFDRSRAFDLIEEAAENGVVDAIYSLGYFYLNGGMGNVGYSEEVLKQKEIETDTEKGIQYLKVAAKYNHPNAIVNLARHYYWQSKDKPRLLKDAIKWWKKGIKIGELSCMVDIGDLHILGIGVKKDKIKAWNLYEKAADCEFNISPQNAAEYRLKHFTDLEEELQQYW